MLKKFTVKGFKQFENLVFDFATVHDYDFSKQCLANSKYQRLLKTLLIYGASASGKTNLGLAIFDIVQHLFDKASIPEAYAFYLNADSPEAPAEFSYEFLFGQKNVTYRYKKVSAKKLVAEELLSDGKVVFRWDSFTGKDDFSHLVDFGFATLNQCYRDREISFLRYVANNSALKARSPVKLVMDFVSAMLFIKRSDKREAFMGLLSKEESIDECIIKNGLTKDLEKFLKANGVHGKLVAKQTLEGKESLFFEHKSLLPFSSCASSGTMALAILFYWKTFFDKASFVFIDGFDACYPANVAATFFLSLTKLPIQILLTAHNTNLLNHKLTRPDCCFEIRDGELRSLSERTSRALRLGNNLEKLYLAGEFND